ncbi:MBL fold metallo-hydrolase [Candidatus Uhrbacteria bacterium]|nr:MBL fold metallo-hydrolase [Candidatus Uhrbacteria bacterium]
MLNKSHFNLSKKGAGSTQLTLFGTGPASPIPRIYCQCRVCTDARKDGSRSRRSRSSALLRVDGKQILFDASPDVLRQLERFKTYQVDALFLTHAHSDAVGGLFDLDDILRKQKHPATLYVEEGTWRRLRLILEDTKPWMTIQKITAGHALKVFGLEVMPFRVEHSAQPGFPTLGYRIGDKLVYASDIKSVPQAAERFIAGAEHAVLDGCFWFDTHFPTHFTLDETIALADRLRVKKLYLTQISHNYPPYPEAARVVAEYCRKQNLTAKVAIAYDGMTIPL